MARGKYDWLSSQLARTKLMQLYLSTQRASGRQYSNHTDAIISTVRFWYRYPPCLCRDPSCLIARDAAQHRCYLLHPPPSVIHPRSATQRAVVNRAPFDEDRNQTSLGFVRGLQTLDYFDDA